MVNKLDSTSLFLAQVNQHAEVLGGLLGGAAQEPIDRGLLGRCIVSTRMLSKSVSLMELPEWQALLDPFQALLELYRDRNLPWDERIADATSAIIEKEDTLVAGAGVLFELREAVPAEELLALSREVNEIAQCAADAPAADALPVGTTASAANAQPEGNAAAAANRAEARGGGPDDRTRTAPPEDPARAGAAKSGPILEKGMAELRRRAEAIGWGAAGQDTAGQGAASSPSPELDDLRADLLVIGFHAFSMERIVGAATGVRSVPFVDGLTPLRAAVEDHAVSSAAARGRSVDLAFSPGEKLPIDARLLQPLYVVLQHLVSDVLLRCGRDDLRVEIGVEEKHGAYRWTLRDNGENFVSDSHVDRDEFLAFYPGLREARKILGDLHSLLWVETDGTEGTRFAFTVPPTLQDRSFVVWENDSIAVLSSQLSGLYRAGEIETNSDSHGERVSADGRWVPLLRLGQVFSHGPADGDRIAVIGSLEKRVAFFVEGEGRAEKGAWKKDGGAAGRGMDGGVVKIGDARIPLVEANGVLQKYMSIVDTAPDEQVSGGVDEVVSVSSHTQANREKDAPAPPESSSKKNEVDVLVVEENEALRRSLAAILQESGLTVKTAGGLDTAMAFLEAGRPAVVISDFRVPTMAAKAIADRLSRDGCKTPVLVTTNQTGKNADVLVARLGVSGYITKPVRGEDVIALVTECAMKGSRRPLRRPSGLAI
jgi:CheY-like chemotaxis protein